MTIVHRTQFSATAVLCGASIFAYPAIAWGVCAPATVDTGAPFVASNQLLEQVRQRREQQATVSMFSAAGSSPAFKTPPECGSHKGDSGGAVFGRGCAKDRVAPNGMLKRRSSKYPPLLRPSAHGTGAR